MLACSIPLRCVLFDYVVLFIYLLMFMFGSETARAVPGNPSTHLCLFLDYVPQGFP